MGQDESLPRGLRHDANGRITCAWHQGLPEYEAYHDGEWGRPVANDIRLFEKICLEGFQSGLSWLTILRKREHFRAAFHGFDFHRVAQMDAADIDRLMQDAGIVRHRGKILSTINNARRAIELVSEHGSLAAYFWSFEPPATDRPQVMTWDWAMANPKTPASIAISKDLKKRGWSFVGPTTIYAFMQAMGLVNDHMQGCHCRDQIEAARNAFARPA